VIDKSVHQVTEFESTENFLGAKSVPAGISTIWENGVPIDLMVSPAGSETTIFFFHGAIERHFTLPVLSGLGISGAVHANRVFVSDPSLVLDDDLLLAWYAGNHQQHNLQEVLTNILSKIAESLGSRRAVFFGGSGGGFASLYFASHFENSLALVFNPQTNIAKYSARAVRDFAVKSFGVEPDSTEPLAQLPPEVVTNVCKLYTTPRRVTVAYLQNEKDTTHVETHLGPFLESLHEDTDLLLLKEPWRDGHSPPPKELLTQVLDLAASSNDWTKDFSSIGFARPLSNRRI
jgi:pimeloyl-ACP methyl ester carboxylesterase